MSHAISINTTFGALPDAAAIEREAETLGFPLRIESIDWANDEGYFPVDLAGIKTGFELFVERSAAGETPEPEKAPLLKRLFGGKREPTRTATPTPVDASSADEPVEVQLVLGGSELGLGAAQCFCVVLARCTGGGMSYEGEECDAEAGLIEAQEGVVRAAVLATLARAYPDACAWDEPALLPWETPESRRGLLGSPEMDRAGLVRVEGTPDGAPSYRLWERPAQELREELSEQND